MIDRQISKQISQLHRRVLSRAERAGEIDAEASVAAWRCGQLLIMCSDRVPGDQWRGWLGQHGVSVVTAQRYQRWGELHATEQQAKDAAGVAPAFFNLGIESKRERFFPTRASHLTFVNAFIRWWHEEDERAPLLDRDEEELARLQNELKPAFDLLSCILQRTPGAGGPRPPSSPLQVPRCTAFSHTEVE